MWNLVCTTCLLCEAGSSLNSHKELVLNIRIVRCVVSICEESKDQDFMWRTNVGGALTLPLLNSLTRCQMLSNWQKLLVSYLAPVVGTVCSLAGGWFSHDSKGNMCQWLLPSHLPPTNELFQHLSFWMSLQEGTFAPPFYLHYVHCKAHFSALQILKL